MGEKDGMVSLRCGGELFCLTGIYMPRGAYRVCHDALKPRCSKHCPSGGALGCQRLACLLAIFFSHFYMGTFLRRGWCLYASRGVPIKP